MKHSCYFAKVCDGEINKKQIRVNLFSLQLCVHGYILCEKGTKLVLRCKGLILEDFRR